MTLIKSLLSKSVIGLFLFNIMACVAMDEKDTDILCSENESFWRTHVYRNLDENPDLRSHIAVKIDPKEQFTKDIYENSIKQWLEREKENFTKIKEEKEKTAETKRKHENERLQASASTHQSTYAAPLRGSESDKGQAENFMAQARFHDTQANSLQYNNYYTVAKDSTVIIAQLVAPSLPPALSPVFLAARQKIYKTAAEIDAEKTKNAYELANIKETEAREMAAIAASLNQGSGRVQTGKGLEEVIKAAHILAELNLSAVQDLQKRQKETSELNEYLTKK
jgi:hypothetical protein